MVPASAFPESFTFPKLLENTLHFIKYVVITGSQRRRAKVKGAGEMASSKHPELYLHQVETSVTPALETGIRQRPQCALPTSQSLFDSDRREHRRAL